MELKGPKLRTKRVVACNGVHQSTILPMHELTLTRRWWVRGPGGDVVHGINRGREYLKAKNLYFLLST